MSKLFCSNSHVATDSIIRHNSSFPVSRKTESNGVYSVVFDKMSQHQESCYWTEWGGVNIVGTPIFREGLEAENIAKYLFDNFSEDTIAQLKCDIVGFWSALLYKEGDVFLFNDYYGIYDICYFKEDGFFCSGNSLADIVRCKNEIEFDEFPFIMENFQNSAFPGSTSFKDVKKLKRSEYIRINNGFLEVRPVDIIPIRANYINTSKSIEDISRLIKVYASKISERYGTVAIGMTGGLDSRLVFAGFNSVGADITCVHGVSSGTCKEDRHIVDEICAKYNKELELHNWEQPSDFILSDQEDVWREVGFSNYLAQGCKEHIEQFKETGKRYAFYQSGYFCEALRLREWASGKGNSFSLVDYVDNYFIDKNLKDCYSNYREYRDYLINHFKEQLSEIGYSGDFNHIPIDIFERFRWQMSRYHDSRSTLNLNNFHYTFSLMAVPYIHEYVLSLPASVIRGGTFQIKLLENLDANLLNFAVFSHRRAYHIKNYKKVPDVTKKNIVDFLFQKLPVVKKGIVSLYQRFKYKTESTHNVLVDQIEDLGISLPQYLNIEKYKGSLVKLRALIIGCHCLAKDKTA